MYKEILIIVAPLAAIYLMYMLFSFIRYRDEIKKGQAIFRLVGRYWKFHIDRKNKKSIDGTVSDFPVKLSIHFEGESYLKIHVSYSIDIDGNFSVSLETKLSRIKESMGLPDIKIGDEDFDSKMRMEASRTYYIPALITKVVRNEISFLLKDAYSFNITEKGITFVRSLSTIRRLKRVRLYVKSIVKIAEQITKDPDLKRRLMESTHSEPLYTVKIMNIRSLIKNFSVDAEIALFLQQLLKNKDINVQVEAARHMESEGMEHLLNMVRKRKNLNDELKIRIIEIFSENRYIKSSGDLQGLYVAAKNNACKIAVLKAFFNFEDTRVSNFILSHLNEADDDVYFAAVKALGTCGTIDAVETLKEIADSADTRDLENEAQKSITKIQSRHGNAEKGWLSMNRVNEKEGALSVNDGAAEGSLSVNNETDPKKDKDEGVSKE